MRGNRGAAPILLTPERPACDHRPFVKALSGLPRGSSRVTPTLSLNGRRLAMRLDPSAQGCAAPSYRLRVFKALASTGTGRSPWWG